MLDTTGGFVLLASEKLIYASPARTGFALSSPRTYPGNNPLSIQSSAGTVSLTTRRVSECHILCHYF
jgi:WW domain-binding protein 2